VESDNSIYSIWAIYTLETTYRLGLSTYFDDRAYKCLQLAMSAMSLWSWITHPLAWLYEL